MSIDSSRVCWVLVKVFIRYIQLIAAPDRCAFVFIFLLSFFFSNVLVEWKKISRLSARLRSYRRSIFASLIPSMIVKMKIACPRNITARLSFSTWHHTRTFYFFLLFPLTNILPRTYLRNFNRSYILSLMFRLVQTKVLCILQRFNTRVSWQTLLHKRDVRYS